jgi:L-Ala-D/L-Glu epimerase / N-acetyl-D-glutamate racemase
MVITKIKVFPIGVRLLKPLKIAKMIREKSSNIIVKIETDEGLVGYGEATAVHFFWGETQASMKDVAENLVSPVLIGEDPTNIIALIDRMNSVIVGNPFAKAAVEMALWDIKGKTLNTPVYNLLGGNRRTSIPVCHAVSYGSLDEMVKKATGLIDLGYKTLKIYCGKEAPQVDLERVRAIRNAVGDNINLYIEINQRWDLKTALSVLPVLEELNIQFMEQPLPSSSRKEMKIFRERSPIPIALDESVFSPEDVVTAKEEGISDIVNIYILKAGGIYNAKRALDISETLKMDAYMGSFNELSISSIASAHVAATIVDLPYPCYLVGPTLYEEDIIKEPLDIRDGMLHLTDKPGFGITVDEKQLEKFKIGG